MSQICIGADGSANRMIRDMTERVEAAPDYRGGADLMLTASDSMILRACPRLHGSPSTCISFHRPFP